jgi:pantoate--beta-alanine ligase
MKIITEVEAMASLCRGWKEKGLRIGLVPTMGGLHEGHLSLVRAARAGTDVVVVSIFVNPTQFRPGEDLDSYPRDIERDMSLLENEKVDGVFHPQPEAMYPEGYRTYVEVHDFQDKLCGAVRPGHFRGVCTVVLKLFNIVRPDVAYFGWKDAQQVLVVRRMAADLNLDTEIVALPLVRDPDGLAMSTRNAYLSPDERAAARRLSKSLAEAEALIAAGETDPQAVVARVRNVLAAGPKIEIEYVAAVDIKNLEPLDRIAGEGLLALAVRIGKTRLIDNILIYPKGEAPC